MSKPIFHLLGLLCLLTALPGTASAQNLDLSWIPSVSAGAAGYYVYIARAVSGALVATRIDVGRPAPDAAGISRVRLSGVDKTAPLLAVEMTTYDSQGRESARSNRVQVAGDGETVGTPLWSNDFNTRSLGSIAARLLRLRRGVRDRRVQLRRAVRRVRGEDDDGPRDLRASSEARVGPGARTRSRVACSRSWAARSRASRSGRWAATSDPPFCWAPDPTETSSIDEVGKPALTCVDAAASTDVLLVRYKWMKFRLRYTNPGGKARLRAKIWNAGAVEPSLWQVDCAAKVADTQDTGVFALYHQGSGATYWDDLVVRPVTGTLTQISYQ